VAQTALEGEFFEWISGHLRIAIVIWSGSGKQDDISKASDFSCGL